MKGQRMKIPASKDKGRLCAAAELSCIIGRVAKIDRDSKIAERTDLDAVWETLYAIKADAQRALRELRRA